MQYAQYYRRTNEEEPGEHLGGLLPEVDDGIREIDAKHVADITKDLRAKNREKALFAALYLFLDETGRETDFKSFQGLCWRNGIDVEAAAKAIWNRLSAMKKRWIRILLHAEGYHRKDCPLYCGGTKAPAVVMVARLHRELHVALGEAVGETGEIKLRDMGSSILDFLTAREAGSEDQRVRFA